MGEKMKSKAEYEEIIKDLNKACLKLIDEKSECEKNFGRSRLPNNDSWRTPKELYDKLDNEFHFNDDPCPIDGNNGLEREWGTRTFMNPPYSKPFVWCKKAVEEMKKGKVIVGLLRGDTSTKWFHEYVLPYAEIRFIRGRLKFRRDGFDGKLSPVTFPSIIVVWNNANEMGKCSVKQETERLKGDKCDKCPYAIMYKDPTSKTWQDKIKTEAKQETAEAILEKIKEHKNCYEYHIVNGKKNTCLDMILLWVLDEWLSKEKAGKCPEN
jgi:phage N-6-adenine-methyltransferase